MSDNIFVGITVFGAVISLVLLPSSSAIMARCLFNEKRTLKRRKLTVLTNKSEQNKTKRAYNFSPVDIYVIDICISTPRYSFFYFYTDCRSDFRVKSQLILQVNRVADVTRKHTLLRATKEPIFKISRLTTPDDVRF